MPDASARIDDLYREHARAILAYLTRIVGRSGSADDLLQETFAQALARPEKLDRAASPRAWLFGIARRLGANAVRRRRRGADLPADLAAPAEAIDPRLERMRAAILRLPAAQRETLELKLKHELSYQEIADVLGVPIGTVRSRLHHAVHALRDRLGGDADDPG